MATRYAAIPAVPQTQLTGPATVILITALKENVELLTGTRGEEDLASKAVAIDMSAINAELTKQDYKNKRAAEYPSVVDQLDDIYHNGIDAWKATIKATKDKYPKS